MVQRQNQVSLELDVNTFRGNLQFTALGDLDGLSWLVACSLEMLDLVDNVIALEDLAKNDVSAVQPTRTS